MRETERRAFTILKLPAGVWAKILPAFGLAAIVIAVVPQKPPSEVAPGTVPPVQMMLLIGILTSAITAAALYWSVTRDMRLAPRVAILAIAYNVLIIAVKFLFAPRGLYEVNRTTNLESFFPVTSGAGALITAGTVLLLYLLTYLLIYTVVRSRLGVLVPRRVRKHRTSLRVVLIVVALLLLAVPGSFVVFLIFVGSGLQYLHFVFTSVLSLAIAVLLAGAASLAAAALSSAADRAMVLGDAAVLVSFFWLGLWFLALYHVLWVVYILVITSIWPLKVVVPK